RSQPKPAHAPHSSSHGALLQVVCGGVYGEVAGNHVGLAGDAAGCGTLQRRFEITELRVAVLDTADIRRDVLGRHRLHQAPADIGRSGSLSDGPVKIMWIAAVAIRQVVIGGEGRQRFCQAVEAGGAVVLHEPAKRLRCRAAYDVRCRSVERIEKADAGGVAAASAWFGSKSPKVVKAAVLPVFVSASRLSGARPPPVLGSSEVNSKFVGVERAARVTLDTLLQVEFKFGGRQSWPCSSPLLLIASAAFRWQPMQAG